jgi:hypothetical protein
MSSNTHFTGPVSDIHNYQTQEIPGSLKSNNSPQCIRANNRHYQLSTSSSSSQNSGGVLLFQIPPTQAAISRQTMYLRCRVSVTATAAATYADADHSITFKGPGPLYAPQKPTDGTNYAGTVMPSLSNGYAWIQRLTLFGGSSSTLEQMNFVNNTMDMLLAHNSNANFLSNEGRVTMGVGRAWDALSATVNYIDLCLPLPLSAFNNSDQDFPLYLMRSPLTLQIDISSFARAITCGAAGAGNAYTTDFTVSNVFLCYEVVDVPHALMEAERHAVEGGHPFIMNLTSWLNVQVNQSVLSSYTLGLNASSLRSVFVGVLGANSYGSTTQINYARPFADAYAAGIANWGSGVNAQLYLDGNVKNSSIFSDPVMQLIQLKQALHNNIQSSVIMSSSGAFYDYITSHSWLSWDCVSFGDEDTIFGGSPVSNLNVQLTGLSNNPTFLAYILCLYDVLLAIGPGGTMEVKR